MEHLLESCRDGLLTTSCVTTSLGWLSILGACFYKLPVILKIIKSKSGAGLNPLSIYLETTAYCCLVLYRYSSHADVSTYGDYLSSITQNVIIIAMLWRWGLGEESLERIDSKHIQLVSSFAFLAIAAVYQLREQVSTNPLLPVYAYAVITLSRVPQIIRNYRNRVVGVQSVITLTNSVLGSINKLNQALNEPPFDLTILCGSVLLLALNLTLAGQVFYLKHVPGAAKKARRASQRDVAHQNGTPSRGSARIRAMKQE